MTKVKFFTDYVYLPKLEDDLNKFLKQHPNIIDVKYQMCSYGYANNHKEYSAMVIYIPDVLEDVST